jgi:hypothetical protein
MNVKQQYPTGKEIVWPHPADGRTVKVTVISYEVDAGRRVTAVNVKGDDFLDGAHPGRLETDGSGLK